MFSKIMIFYVIALFYRLIQRFLLSHSLRLYPAPTEINPLHTERVGVICVIIGWNVQTCTAVSPSPFGDPDNYREGMRQERSNLHCRVPFSTWRRGHDEAQTMCKPIAATGLLLFCSPGSSEWGAFVFYILPLLYGLGNTLLSWLENLACRISRD